MVFGAPKIADDEIAEVIDSLKSGWIGSGPKVKRFEADFALFKECRYAIGVNSCTAALQLALVGLGIGPGDEVITTSFTFCSTVNVIIHAGATPVLVDVDAKTLNINCEEIEKRISNATKAIIVVHFAGRPCDMDAIMHIANKYDLKVIEDCAHAVEATYHSKNLGTIGDVGCFSFYATKNITTGEGGMLTTNSEQLATRMRSLSLHGLSGSAWNRFGSEGFKHYTVEEVGYKFNMTDIQAAIGIHQLEKVEKFHSARKVIWNTYQEGLRDLDLVLPTPPEPNTEHALHLFPIFLGLDNATQRNAFLDLLTKYKIGVGVHYLAIPEHPVYQKLYGWRPESFPVATKLGRTEISLPISAHMVKEDADYVVEAIHEIVGQH